MSQTLYSDDDAEAILRLASRKMSGGSTSKESLIASAAELGISAEAVEEAEQEMFRDRKELSAREEFFARRKARFYTKLGGGVSTSFLMIAINYYTAGSINWAIWVVLATVGSLADCGWETFNRSSDKHEKAFRKWQIDGKVVDEEDEEREERKRRRPYSFRYEKTEPTQSSVRVNS